MRKHSRKTQDDVAASADWFLGALEAAATDRCPSWQPGVIAAYIVDTITGKYPNWQPGAGLATLKAKYPLWYKGSFEDFLEDEASTWVKGTVLTALGAAYAQWLADNS